MAELLAECDVGRYLFSIGRASALLCRCVRRIRSSFAIFDASMTLVSNAFSSPFGLLRNSKSDWLFIYSLLFHCAIVIVLTITPFVVLRSIGHDPLHALSNFPVTNLLSRTLVIAIVYLTNVYVLIPRFLHQRKYLPYILILIACCSVAVGYISHALDAAVNDPFGDFPGKPPIAASLFPLLLCITIGTSFEMIVNWERQITYQQQVEKEKAEAELSFLKSQINPHFLFNSLNSIYSLAEVKSDKTSTAVLLLSHQMRYLLYEAKEERIPLTKEIEFIKNVIDLQKIRTSSNSVMIEFSIHMEREDHRHIIAPLLFLPLVENAFKHGVSYQTPSFIRINLTVTEHSIVFSVRNSKRNKTLKDVVGGIGLHNLTRRLALIYPNQYTLDIHELPESFQAELTIYC